MSYEADQAYKENEATEAMIRMRTIDPSTIKFATKVMKQSEDALEKLMSENRRMKGLLEQIVAWHEGMNETNYVPMTNLLEKAKTFYHH
jgi:hypothetical protein